MPACAVHPPSDAEATTGNRRASGRRTCRRVPPLHTDVVRAREGEHAADRRVTTMTVLGAVPLVALVFWDAAA